MWHAPIQHDGTPHGELDPPPELVADCKRQIEEECAGWDRFFDQHQVSPLRVSYEEFVADPDSTVRRICRYSQVDLGDRPIPCGLYRKLG